MDGIHDLGGMQGFGPVPFAPEEPGRFHARWEGAAGAMTFAILRSGITNIDAFRHRMERIDPLSYFSVGYWGRWLTGQEATLIEQGVTTQEEIEEVIRNLGRSPDESAHPPRLHPTIALESRENAPGALRETTADRRFSLGDKVRMPAVPPSDGHHRVPRYVRNKVGEIVRLYPSFALPDARAHDQGEAPQYVYAVRFTGTEIWGPDADPRLVNNFDVFESYLEPA